MWFQFLSQNLHFAINLFAALVCLSVTWLYFDAWVNGKQKKELLHWCGFGLLSASFLVQSTVIEQSIFGETLFGENGVGLAIAFRLISFVLIIAGQLVDPLQNMPSLKGLGLDDQQNSVLPDTTIKKTKNKKQFSFFGSIGIAAMWLLPFAAIAIAALYWRRATTGLERHLRPVAYGFGLLALAQFLELAKLLRGHSNPMIDEAVKAFGSIWIVAHILLLMFAVILLHWAWVYITRRFFSQLYIVSLLIVLCSFLAVSMVFAGLTLRDVSKNELSNLEVAVKTVDFATSAKESETYSGASQLASSEEIKRAVINANHAELVRLTQDYLPKHKQSDLVITNESGMVLLRGHNADQWGDSLSSSSLIKRALLGISSSSKLVEEAVGSPLVKVSSTVPILNSNGLVIGSVSASLTLDSAFVDGVKQATGLQSSIYGGNTLSATTLLSSDGKNRNVGTKLINESIQTEVLNEGKSFAGSLNTQNRKILGAFVPIKDIDNEVIGMYSVEKSQSGILASAGRSIELTILFTTILLLVGMFPIYIITKSIAKQLG